LFIRRPEQTCTLAGWQPGESMYSTCMPVRQWAFLLPATHKRHLLVTPSCLIITTPYTPVRNGSSPWPHRSVSAQRWQRPRVYGGWGLGDVIFNTWQEQNNLPPCFLLGALVGATCIWFRPLLGGPVSLQKSSWRLLLDGHHRKHIGCSASSVHNVVHRTTPFGACHCSLRSRKARSDQTSTCSVSA
jgi:hypothetical protein